MLGVPLFHWPSRPCWPDIKACSDEDNPVERIPMKAKAMRSKHRVLVCALGLQEMVERMQGWPQRGVHVGHDVLNRWSSMGSVMAKVWSIPGDVLAK